jgi:hypothetical protein
MHSPAKRDKPRNKERAKSERIRSAGRPPEFEKRVCPRSGGVEPSQNKCFATSSPFFKPFTAKTLFLRCVLAGNVISIVSDGGDEPLPDPSHPRHHKGFARDFYKNEASPWAGPHTLAHEFALNNERNSNPQTSYAAREVKIMIFCSYWSLHKRNQCSLRRLALLAAQGVVLASLIPLINGEGPVLFCWLLLTKPVGRKTVFFHFFLHPLPSVFQI